MNVNVTTSQTICFLTTGGAVTIPAGCGFVIHSLSSGLLPGKVTITYPKLPTPERFVIREDAEGWR